MACQFTTSSLVAQSEKEADEAALSREYRKSYIIYQQLVKNAGDNINLWHKYADAARLVNDYKTAETYYTKVLEDGENFHFAMDGFWLGQIKKNLGRYDEAIELFKIFSMMGLDDYYTNWAANEITTCQWAANAQSVSSDIQVDLLDDKINSNYSETGAVESGNQLYYTTYRSVFKEDRNSPKRHLANIMVSKNLERGRAVTSEFNENGKHVSNADFSKDWQRMYFTVCEFLNDEKETCQIHFMEQNKNGRWEKKSEALPEHINLPGCTSMHPAVGYDPSTKNELLFFVSDRPNGIGKKDIWYSEIGIKGFSDPINLTAVNTSEDDVTPFFHNESQTLFFASKGQPGFGGFDVFFTAKKERGWSKVENVGQPINSSYDDLYFSKNMPGNRAYLSSNRPGSRFHRGMNEGCCLDIYRVYFN